MIDPDQFPGLGPINIRGLRGGRPPVKERSMSAFSGNIYLSTSPNWANSTGHPLLSTTFANNVGQTTRW